MATLFSQALAQQQLTLIPVAHSWKYNLSGTDLTAQFQLTNYNDSAWPQGPGLLGYESSSPFPYPEPIRTPFPLGSSYQTTIYFRTHFNFPSNTLGAVLRATNYVDDGAIFYLNGHEVQRLRMPAGPVSFGTLALSISNPEGQANVTQFAITNLLQGDNVLAVEVHQHEQFDPDVIFGMSLIAFLPEPGPVRITNQPPARTVEAGETTTFTAEIAGTPPYFFQWFKNGSPIDNATNSSLTLSFVSSNAAGDYSFTVSNEFSSAVSSNAMLTIAPRPFYFVSITNAWRYHAAGVNLGATWRSTAFDDGPWAQGTGVFHNYAHPLPAPKGTSLPLTNSSNQRITTWYFRTRFDWSGSTAGVSLRAKTLIDDGAVFYINGVEAGRLGMAAAPTVIGYNTLATYKVESITNYTVIELATFNLVQGQNILAVEVHQSASTISDVVFGIALGTNLALTLPDLIFWGPRSAWTEAVPLSVGGCEINEGCGNSDTRRVLRFDTETRNLGQADLILGDPQNNPLFEYDSCHGHLHFDHFAEYRLLDTNGVLIRTGNKVGFCLLDFNPWDPNAAPQGLYDCDYQGIQRGWSDIYPSYLDCQWVDVTGLPGGNYILALEVDPENRIPESDENNNVTHVLVSFPDCPPPPNDDFEAASVITAPLATVTVDTTCASKQFTEPFHASQPGGGSVWYRWTAPGGGRLLVSTAGSRFDTLLGAYRGNSLINLTYVASNDDYSTYETSRIAFDVTSNTTYSIAVDGAGGEVGAAVVAFNYKPMVPPVFLACEYLSNQQCRLTLSGGPGDAYSLEITPDLRTWTEWLRRTNHTGTVQVIDSMPTLPPRFYRARVVP